MTAIRPGLAEFKPYVPAAYGKTPETPSEVLEAAACVLEEEGRWAQGTWFKHHDPTHEEYKENPYCNGWSACADGALQVVTTGAYRRPYLSAAAPFWFVSGISPAYLDDDNGRKAYALYTDAVDIADRYLNTQGVGGLISLNDRPSTTRTTMVETLRAAAEYGRKLYSENAA